MTITTSISALGCYLDCPAKYHFNYVLKKPGLITYAMLCGTLVHSKIKLLYDQRAKNRKFFYKTPESLRGAWFFEWNREVNKNKDRIMDWDIKKGGLFGGLGWICLNNYWVQNFYKPDPIEIERKRSYQVIKGVNLHFIPDQIRRVDNSFIEKYRPTILNDGKLSDQFDNVVIVDFKTGQKDPDRDTEGKTLDIARNQFPLQNIQAAAYVRGYNALHGGKWPICFIFYYLQYGKFFIVMADDPKMQKDLDNVVWHLVGNLNAQSFPRRVSANCYNCGYVQDCIGEEGLNVSITGSAPDGPLLRTVFRKEKKSEEPRQLKLKFSR